MSHIRYQMAQEWYKQPSAIAQVKRRSPSKPILKNEAAAIKAFSEDRRNE